MWICQDYDEISEDSLLYSNESLQTINKNENSGNHVEKNISGTDSTKRKMKRIWYENHVRKYFTRAKF